MNKKVILLILDGWGNTQDPSISAPARAETPFMDAVIKKYPHATLLTHGANVGLPEGQMGNSEVGHMNLGAGRIVYQDLAKINLAITNDTLKDEKVVQKAFSFAKNNHKNVHFQNHSRIFLSPNNQQPHEDLQHNLRCHRFP